MPTLTGTMTITAIGTQKAGVPFTVSGTFTLNESTWTDQLIYEDNLGAQVPIASSAVTIGVSSWSYTHAGDLAVGSHTITAKDSLTGAAATSNSFLVIASDTITVAAITGAVAGAAFAFTGALTGYASAPGLTYSLTGPISGGSAPVAPHSPCGSAAANSASDQPASPEAGSVPRT